MRRASAAPRYGARANSAKSGKKALELRGIARQDAARAWEGRLWASRPARGGGRRAGRAGGRGGGERGGGAGGFGVGRVPSAGAGWRGSGPGSARRAAAARRAPASRSPRGQRAASGTRASRRRWRGWEGRRLGWGGQRLGWGEGGGRGRGAALARGAATSRRSRWFGEPERPCRPRGNGSRPGVCQRYGLPVRSLDTGFQIRRHHELGQLGEQILGRLCLAAANLLVDDPDDPAINVSSIVAGSPSP